MKYRRVPGDAVTERIIEGFEDFEGWTDEPQKRARLKRGATTEAFTTETVASSAPPAAQELPAGHDGLRCPTCHVLLPDDDHLVTSANPVLLDQMRVIQGIKPAPHKPRKASVTNTENIVVTGGLL